MDFVVRRHDAIGEIGKLILEPKIGSHREILCRTPARGGASRNSEEVAAGEVTRTAGSARAFAERSRLGGTRTATEQFHDHGSDVHPEILELPPIASNHYGFSRHADPGSLAESGRSGRPGCGGGSHSAASTGRSPASHVQPAPPIIAILETPTFIDPWPRPTVHDLAETTLSDRRPGIAGPEFQGQCGAHRPAFAGRCDGPGCQSS